MKPTQHPNAPQETKVKLHALYKQAMRGACTESRPKGFNFTGKSKWDAWKALDDMSQEEARVTCIYQLLIYQLIIHAAG